MNIRTRYMLKRLAFVPFGAFVILTATFFLTNAIPSDPARAVAGPGADAATVDAIRERLGLTGSLFERYLTYLSGVVRGNLGTSYYSPRTVWSDLRQYLCASLVLVVMSMVVAIVIGALIGGMAAYFEGRTVDRGLRQLMTVTQVTPSFLVGLLMIYAFFYYLGWFPGPTGQLGLLDIRPPTVTGSALLDAIIAGDGPTTISALQHAIMPVLTLGITLSAVFALTTRALVSRSLSSFQVEYARACGLPTRKVFTYALLASRTQLITYTGVLFAGMLGGSVLVETVFAWNGIGQYLVSRVQATDLPPVQGIVLVLGTLTLLVYVLLDVIVAMTDPRVSFAGSK